jgi:magnesium-transporting ATPase (P-type)
MVRSSSASPSDAGTGAWHARPPEEVLSEFGASDGGLSAENARLRLDRYGPNRLPSAQKTSALTSLLRQIRSPLMYALLASAALALMLGEVADGLVVAAVVLLSALIGFFQELRAERAITALAELVAELARVCRDEAWTELPAEQVVPGDLVAVGQGGRVAADLRERWRVRRVAGPYGREP